MISGLPHFSYSFIPLGFLPSCWNVSCVDRLFFCPCPFIFVVLRLPRHLLIDVFLVHPVFQIVRFVRFFEHQPPNNRRDGSPRPTRRRRHGAPHTTPPSTDDPGHRTRRCLGCYTSGIPTVNNCLCSSTVAIAIVITRSRVLLINLPSRYLNCWKLQQRKEHPVAS